MFELYRHLFTRRLILNATLGTALFFMIVGVIFWGGFNTAMEKTNTLTFCISCHEMEDNVFQEYKQTIHYKNRTGIRAICSDCHVPRPWHHKVVRKIQASNELIHKITGSINTREKFIARRQHLAKKVWSSMQQTDSRECRNCHTFDAMDIKAQQSRSGLVHKYSQKRGKTCIDCHKGIAHELPDDIEPYRGGSDNDHEYYKTSGLECQQCHKDMQKKDTEEDWGF